MVVGTMNVLRLRSTTEILSSFLETSINFSFTSVGRYFVLFVVEIVLVGDPRATTEKGKSTPSPHTYFCPVLAHKPLTVIRRGHMTTSSWKSSMVYEAISSFPDFPDFSNPTYEALHVCYWLFGSDIKIWRSFLATNDVWCVGSTWVRQGRLLVL